MIRANCRTCGHVKCMCRQPLGNFTTPIIENPYSIENQVRRQKEYIEASIELLIKEYPNDLELGQVIRKIYGK